MSNVFTLCAPVTECLLLKIERWKWISTSCVFVLCKIWCNIWKLAIVQAEYLAWEFMMAGFLDFAIENPGTSQCAIQSQLARFIARRKNWLQFVLVSWVLSGSKWTARQKVFGWRHFEVKDKRKTSSAIYALLTSTCARDVQFWVKPNLNQHDPIFIAFFILYFIPFSHQEGSHMNVKKPILKQKGWSTNAEILLMIKSLNAILNERIRHRKLVFEADMEAKPVEMSSKCKFIDHDKISRLFYFWKQEGKLCQGLNIWGLYFILIKQGFDTVTLVCR